jgi:hypothetical protein
MNTQPNPDEQQGLPGKQEKSYDLAATSGKSPLPGGPWSYHQLAGGIDYQDLLQLLSFTMLKTKVYKPSIV